MKGKFLEGADAVVLTASLAIVGGLVAWGVLAPDNLNTVMGGALTWMIAQFGWVFILIALGALGFCVFLVIHPWGKIKLGPDDSTPDFSTPSWVSMMFAAGLGAGILFYGISEPISHFSAPPHGLAEPEPGRLA